ncbi:MAG: helix-turn-helix transcriptional regulator [Clostridia bacterium]|nr:helix-turn-helix transcriptional regulator [Clostridia bacterium]
MSKKFGELVKEYRGKKTLKELGDEIGITAAYLSDIEKGNRFPSEDKLKKLIKIFDLKDEKQDNFYDLVAEESPNKYKVSGDIAEYIMKNQYLRNFIRVAKNKKLGNLYWKSKLKELERGE